MKSIKIIVVAMLTAVLCFAATAMASEFSFYDSVNDWLVRAYAAQNPTGGTYTVYLEMLNDDGTSVLPADIVVTKNGVPVTPAALGYPICGSAVSPEISIAYKFLSVETELYVFDTHVPGEPAELHNNTLISRNNPVPPANISVSGNGVFGDVDVDATPPTRVITVSNTGTANLILGDISVTGTGFSQVAGGCADGQTLTQGLSCTITVQFDPTTEGAYVGSLSIPSNDPETPTAVVSLSGTGEEAAPPSGNVDITFPLYVGLNAQTSVENNQTFSVTAKVVNKGTEASGPFVVKLWWSLNKVPGDVGEDILLGTWNVSQLNPGQTLTYTYSNLRVTGQGIHQTYYLIGHADANDDIGETNETNNLFFRTITVSR